MQFPNRTMLAITDIMQHLEGIRPSRLTKEPEEFKDVPLKGLWKVHFFDQRFMVKNLINEWELYKKDSEKFNRLFERIVREEEAEPSNVAWQGRLAHALVIEGYRSRSSRKELTGEWLIFGKHEGKNYYLCITRHSKRGEGDARIYNVIHQSCAQEFPFLFIH